MNILITGAASGLGEAAVDAFLAAGHNVYGLDIKEISPKANLTTFKVDITNKNDLQTVSDALKEKSIYLDAIINFAGIHIIGSLIEADISQIEKIISINLTGTILVNQVFFYNLAKNGRIIITTSEVAPLDPMPFNGIYNITKTALDCYSQTLRQELGLLGIKVITLRPGAFNTALAVGSLSGTEKLCSETILYKKQSHKFLKIVKMFMGKPKNPSVLANKVYRITTKKHPKLIYTIHRNFLLTLMSILPLRLQCFIIKKILK